MIFSNFTAVFVCMALVIVFFIFFNEIVASFFIDKLIFLAFIVLFIMYFYWRFTYTIPSRPPGGGVDFFPLSQFWGWIFVVFEFMSAILTLFLVYMFCMGNRRKIDKEAIFDRQDPSDKPIKIDVFIPTYNEPVDLLEHTLICAVSIKYDNYEVFLLDDGRREEVKKLAERFGVTYITRENNIHYKAGNLNNALEITKDTGASHFLLLDADFRVKEDIIDLMMPYFKSDDVAIVQAAQRFYDDDALQNNLNLGRSYPSEQGLQFNHIMRCFDKMDSAFCCGSPAIYRRDVLDEVGGFPVFSITEDITLSTMLYDIGYKTQYVHEDIVCAYGMSPQTISQYIVQRRRWWIGQVQLGLSKYSPIKLGNKLPASVRFPLAHIMLSFILSIYRLIFILAPCLYWFFSISTFSGDVTVQNYLLHFGLMLGVLYVFNLCKSRGVLLPVITDVVYFASSLVNLFSLVNLARNPRHVKFDVTDKSGESGGGLSGYSFIPLGFLVLSVAAIIVGLFRPSVNIYMPWLVSIWSVICCGILFYAFLMCTDSYFVRDYYRVDKRVTFNKEGIVSTFKAKVLGLNYEGIKLSGVSTRLAIGDVCSINFGEDMPNLKVKVERKSMRGVHCSYVEQECDILKVINNFLFSKGNILIVSKVNIFTSYLRFLLAPFTR